MAHLVLETEIAISQQFSFHSEFVIELCPRGSKINVNPPQRLSIELTSTSVRTKAFGAPELCTHSAMQCIDSGITASALARATCKSWQHFATETHTRQPLKT